MTNQFYNNTIAEFVPAIAPDDREPDYISFKKFSLSEIDIFGFDFKLDDDSIDIDRFNADDLVQHLEGIYIDGAFCPRIDTFYKKMYDRRSRYYEDIAFFLFEDRREESSLYWYTKTGVYRKSPHWGKVGSCEWTISSETATTGFCSWEKFKQKME